jgi:hypothetical protein
MYEELFRLRSTDPRLLTTFFKDARQPGGVGLLDYPARYNPEWVAEHLPLLKPSADAEMWSWLILAGRGDRGIPKSELAILRANQARLLTATAMLGEPHIKSLIEQVLALPRTSMRESLIAALQAHPDFAVRLPE